MCNHHTWEHSAFMHYARMSLDGFRCQNNQQIYQRWEYEIIIFNDSETVLDRNKNHKNREETYNQPPIQINNGTPWVIWTAVLIVHACSSVSQARFPSTFLEFYVIITIKFVCALCLYLCAESISVMVCNAFLTIL